MAELRSDVRYLSLITDWISAAEQAHLNVRSLAAHCGVTDRHLRRYFHQTFGCPPGRWLAELQLWTSINLLFDGYSIKEVSAQLGFKSPSQFSSRFHRRFQTCPSKFLGDAPAMHRALALARDQADTADNGPTEPLARLRADVRVKLIHRLEAISPAVTRPANRRSKTE